MQGINLGWLLLSLLSIGVKAESFSQLTLHNDQVELHITPAIGGRVVGFNLKGHENFLKVGTPFKQGIRPDVSPTTDNIGYLGHIVWVGPQSQWWRKQQLNLQRYQNSAVWPPDPYLTFTDNKIVKHSPSEVVLEGAASPISGMQINKTFRLDPVNPNKVQLSATGVNISQQNHSWDLWFNTRVNIDTHVIVPVNRQQDIRLVSFENTHTGPINYRYSEQYLILDSSQFERQKPANQGKLYIRPKQGWMAGYRQGQLFIIQFPLLATELIHPEQAQVELYASYAQSNTEKGLIEMELHSPFRDLAPSDSIQFSSNWYLYEYPADFSQQDILAMLANKIKLLAL
ncbi:DUF4380 domain-containing protein [Neptunicella sp. SCSIO 80796]|uniref:DUF4380 domain-containing protein n=1 Tax=Neptunicella plasticusilytica TaxID=3117012 RepID=UPI003A4D9164